MSSDKYRASQAVGIEKFLQTKVRRVDAIFLNRKSLEVRYRFEDKETEGLIMIDVNSLQPIFGGSRPTAARSFETLDKLSAFAQENIHFNQCSNYRYADCVCHLFANHIQTEYPESEMFPSSGCPLGHFHHACGSCVSLWLNEYLRVLILRRESRLLFTMAAYEICSRVRLSNDFYATTTGNLLNSTYGSLKGGPSRSIFLMTSLKLAWFWTTSVNLIK